MDESLQTGGAVECGVCEAAVKAAEDKVDDPATIKQLETWADDICAKAPLNLTSSCDALVAKELPALVQALISKVSPEEVCTLLGQCGNSSLPMPTFSSHFSAECVLCEAAVDAAEKQIESPADIAKIVAWMEGLCSDAPASLQTECKLLVAGTQRPTGC